MRILLLSTYDHAGGAERVAYDTLQAYRAVGHDARMLVRYKRGDSPYVDEADQYAGAWPWAGLIAGVERQVARRARFRGQYRLREILRGMALPRRLLDRQSGREDFNFPYARRLLAAQWRPDVIHAHNLHGDYFDLSALAELSGQIPVVWTLHDTWAFAGHCGYFIDCERWRSGCGSCPDLRRPPAISADRTAENWRRKREIYARSRIAVATPSRWLMGLVEQSILRPVEAQVIPYGVATDIYRPGDRAAARAALGLPADAFLAMLIAFNATTSNPYKDVTTIRRAVADARARPAGRPVHLIYVGRSEEASSGQDHYTGYISDPRRLALYYQAADVLLHAAAVDNYPCVIQEALACGTPVIATAVGGIPEQLRPGETGLLVPRGDASGMAEAIHTLRAAPERLAALQRATAADHWPYPLERQTARYLEWFEALRASYREEQYVH
ncbi:MAG: glycosyltransferase [Chloroflexales bacterium]|nr:glycosyltransferase [Chloroflexales bacterium]